MKPLLKPNGEVDVLQFFTSLLTQQPWAKVFSRWDLCAAVRAFVHQHLQFICRSMSEHFVLHLHLPASTNKQC